MAKLIPTSRFELDACSTRRLAALFTLFLFGFESSVLGVSYSDHIIWLFDNDSPLFASITLLCAVGSLLLVFVFFRAAFSSSWRYKPFYLFIAVISFLAEYSYQKALGRFSELTDIELAFATTFEQKVASVLMYLGYSALVPLALFVVLLVVTKTREKSGFRWLVVVNGLMVGSVLVLCVFSISRFRTVSTFALYRTSVEFMLFGPVAQGKWGSEITGVKVLRFPVKTPSLPEGYMPTNNIVFIIDESVRGDHLSLNGYERETTPFLDKLHSQGLLHNWGIAAAATTGSQPTYNTIFTGLSPDDFPDPRNIKLNTTPTLFQYAKAMRYRTWFFDGQMDGFWAGIPDDRNWIDHWLPSKDLIGSFATNRSEVDLEIAKRVKKIIGTSQGNFIFVFKNGTHIPYHHNYPPGQAYWQPAYETTNRYNIPGPDRLHEVVNAYDSSIRYNVNAFFENLVDDYENLPNNTTILYTGDHGQTLYANGMASHGGETVEEANVPLFIIGKKAAGTDTRYKASHCNIFPTLTELMSYPEELRVEGRCLSLLKARANDSRPRFFNKASLGPKIRFD